MMYLISDGGIKTNIPDTIEAIMLTKNISYIDGIKLDVRVTSDNVFVLSKYNELNKLTYSNSKINEVSYDYLKKVKFPSHIFKYYVPTLYEVLKNYDYHKIIMIELFTLDNLESLYNLLQEYHYQYFFYSENKKVLEELKNNHFNNIGIIIDNDSNIDIIKNTKNNILIIKNKY